MKDEMPVSVNTEAGILLLCYELKLRSPLLQVQFL